MNDASLIDMALQLRDIAHPPCTICTPEYVCWYHRSFDERVKQCGTTIFANGFEK